MNASASLPLPFTPNLPAESNAHSPHGHLHDAARWQETLRRFYGRVRHADRGRWVDYYYVRIIERLKEMIPAGSRVLDVGCGTGHLLASLEPSYGVGIDLNESVISEARNHYPMQRFEALGAEQVGQLDEKFDYIVICQALGEIYDLQALFRALQSVCHSRTRLIVVHYSRVWQPLLRLLEWMKIKSKSPEQNWVPTDEIEHLLRLSGFETIRSSGMTIAPFYFPGLSAFLNRGLGNLPFVNQFGLNNLIVARCVAPQVIQADQPRSVSIIVPARNEAGHVDSILQRMPRLAEKQEVIFVEGGSTDATWWTIQRAAREYTGPFTIKTMQQPGSGKGDAVRTGFAAATGDVLMILDADLSVPPEELTRFYDCLVRGQGEFINGSRMVYMMDKQAMRFLNLLGNKFFGWMFTYLLSQRFRDTLCGTKVLTRGDYERIAANRARFGDFDPFGDFDLLFGAAKANLKIVDVPVHYKARVYGETNISRFRHGWMLLRMCVFAARKLKFV
ncbi:MAG: glycosyltransferase [Planctomycetes bacterium]|nr:glycosyltransferase [Planctomycetota bacterium]MBI3833713.1 glycosyltransferase [Planctomycetota bacterium]